MFFHDQNTDSQGPHSEDVFITTSGHRVFFGILFSALFFGLVQFGPQWFFLSAETCLVVEKGCMKIFFKSFLFVTLFAVFSSILFSLIFFSVKALSSSQRDSKQSGRSKFSLIGRVKYYLLALCLALSILAVWIWWNFSSAGAGYQLMVEGYSLSDLEFLELLQSFLATLGLGLLLFGAFNLLLHRIKGDKDVEE